MELLVVIGIIALLATVGLPALKGFGKGNKVTAAQRQILDDVALARLQAISTRSTVYLVFVPPTLMQHFASLTEVRQLRQLTNLISGQFTAYALFSRRSVGTQPGQQDPRYLSDWRRLPEGMLIATNKFDPSNVGAAIDYQRGFYFEQFPFPTARSPLFTLPYLAFNSQGQLVSGRDELIPLAEGSILFPKTRDGRFDNKPADVVVRPPQNFTNNYVRINWLTGRASMDEATRPQFRN